MDIVEFAEKCMHMELPEWQRKYLRTMYEVTRDNDVRIVMGKGGRVYTYVTPKTVKELIQNGATPDSNQ